MRFPAWRQYRVTGPDIQGSIRVWLKWRRLHPVGVHPWKDQTPQAEACATQNSGITRSKAEPIRNDHSAKTAGQLRGEKCGNVHRTNSRKRVAQ
jgi:hypothetical protein